MFAEMPSVPVIVMLAHRPSLSDEVARTYCAHLPTAAMRTPPGFHAAVDLMQLDAVTSFANPKCSFRIFWSLFRTHDLVQSRLISCRHIISTFSFLKLKHSSWKETKSSTAETPLMLFNQIRRSDFFLILKSSPHGLLGVVEMGGGNVSYGISGSGCPWRVRWKADLKISCHS